MMHPRLQRKVLRYYTHICVRDVWREQRVQEGWKNWRLSYLVLIRDQRPLYCQSAGSCRLYFQVQSRSLGFYFQKKKRQHNLYLFVGGMALLNFFLNIFRLSNKIFPPKNVFSLLILIIVADSFIINDVRNEDSGHSPQTPVFWVWLTLSSSPGRHIWTLFINSSYLIW